MYQYKELNLDISRINWDRSSSWHLGHLMVEFRRRIWAVQVLYNFELVNLTTTELLCRHSVKVRYLGR